MFNPFTRKTKDVHAKLDGSKKELEDLIKKNIAIRAEEYNREFKSFIERIKANQ